VIFATVGSHPTYGFDRFLRALEDIPGESLVVQYGPGRPPANAEEAQAWMSFPEILDHMSRAEKVVSHAGTGTILCARRAGHLPVVVPRLSRFGETVDDHQLELGRALAATGRIVLVEDIEELAEVLAAAPSRGEAQPAGSSQLAEAVREALVGLA